MRRALTNGPVTGGRGDGEDETAKAGTYNTIKVYYLNTNICDVCVQVRGFLARAVRTNDMCTLHKEHVDGCGVRGNMEKT